MTDRQPALLAHQPKITADPGKAGGPTYAYRGAVIHSAPKDAQFSVWLTGAPFDGWSGLGHLGLPVRLVNEWLDHQRLAAPYRMPEPPR